MKNKILVVIIVLIIGAIFGYNYIYQSHRDIATESADFTLTAKNIISQFEENQTKADSLYLDKTIQISGKITEISETDLTIDGIVFCSLSTKTTSIKRNDIVTIKGRCIGYDDLLEQLKLDQTSIIKTQPQL